MNTTSETLNRAADLIEERGWKSGSGWPESDDAGKPLCLEGGIMAAIGVRVLEDMDPGEAPCKTVESCPSYAAVQEYLSHSDPLWQWNDSSRRTQHEVIEVLRAAAVDEAARESAAVEVVGWRGTYPNIAAAYVADAPASVGASA